MSPSWDLLKSLCCLYIKTRVAISFPWKWKSCSILTALERCFVGSKLVSGDRRNINLIPFPCWWWWCFSFLEVTNPNYQVYSKVLKLWSAISDKLLRNLVQVHVGRARLKWIDKVGRVENGFGRQMRSVETCPGLINLRKVSKKN